MIEAQYHTRGRARVRAHSAARAHRVRAGGHEGRARAAAVTGVAPHEGCARRAEKSENYMHNNKKSRAPGASMS